MCRGVTMEGTKEWTTCPGRGTRIPGPACMGQGDTTRHTGAAPEQRDASRTGQFVPVYP